MTRVVITIVAAAIALSGCQTTKPGDAADLKYRLPRTDADVSLTLTLTSCSPLQADADLTIAAKPGAQDMQYFIPGKALASNSIKRSIKVTLADGVITGINSSNTDQTAQIVGSVIKTALAVAPLLGPLAHTKSNCTADVENAVARAGLIKKQISALRVDLADAKTTADAAAKDVDQIDKLAKELAALQTGVLQLQATGTVKLDATHADPQVVHFTEVPLAKWFGDDIAKKIKNDKTVDVDKLLGLTWIATPVQLAMKEIGEDADEPSRNCNLSLPMPNPVIVQLNVQGTDGMIVNSDTTKKLVLPVAQWNDPTQLCVDVGFGENREVDLSFDKYGQTTQFNWITDATGANVASAIAGYAPDLAKIDTTLNPNPVDAQNAEITRLQTQQKYNQLKACRAVIEAGGFTCPAAQ